MAWRAERLGNLWSWLLQFRAVAETEHLPTAAAGLAVSPSALSRTIKLLEEEVGQPLFDRVGRNIRLNPAGRMLLVAARDAMRITDEGVSALRGQEFAGPVRVAVSGPFAPQYVLPALPALRQSHPGLVVHIVGAERVNQRLHKGEIDLALVDDAITDDGLTTEQLEVVTHGVYCGAGHALHRRRRVDIDDLGEHPFAAPIQMPSGFTPDEWPDHVPRTVGLRVTQMQVGIDACRTGQFLAVLPDRIGKREGLRRLPVEIAGTATMFAIKRAGATSESRADAVLAAIRAVV